jgi:hypothetical protein
VALGRGDEEGWYIRDVGPDQVGQIWHFTARAATHTGVTNPEAGPGHHYTAGSGETIWDALRRMTPWLEGMDDPGPFQRMLIAPGRYHPRIARPIAPIKSQELWLPEPADDQRYVAEAQNQFGSLIASLTAICRVVNPAPATLSIYGHEIRNLLILAATEAEMHLRGILIANGKTVQFNTNEYVKLADPLRLRDYKVRFHSYLDINPFQPFALWDKSDPTGSLGWFAAYNGVKHNREFEFARATLENAFKAVAACAVLLVAQFGQRGLTPELRRLLSVEDPSWPLDQMYMPPQTNGGWIALPHPMLG